MNGVFFLESFDHLVGRFATKRVEDTEFAFPFCAGEYFIVAGDEAVTHTFGLALGLGHGGVCRSRVGRL